MKNLRSEGERVLRCQKVPRLRPFGLLTGIARTWEWIYQNCEGVNFGRVIGLTQGGIIWVGQ